MKLYFNPRSRAVIARWMLDECGAQYEIVPIDFEKKEHKSPEFLKINPAGKLPALVDGDTRLFESAAICLYLAEKFPDAQLAPKPGDKDWGRYLSLMVYSTSQLEPAMGDHLMKLPTGPARGWTDFETVLNVIEGELGQGPYLFGERFTAADVMVGSMFIWMRIFGSQTGRPALEAYIERLLARPKSMKLG
ncbi:glutathione S-transferase family protein [Myxococcus xanthus]|uniref:Glutathione S-transferase family protein n=1 Tax=Myxococcus xanthus TaxID=34 RepID=A0A7Y4MUS7_MYXXA|nr:glutathione S-transferase family protein [Myxococcus xanthus]NOJ83009.1 glutathione S-transferase family protein [Myxococcus xanthus]NOJ89927.1 glutathione S-transferase family protein [Myxococcus xanthus]